MEDETPWLLPDIKVNLCILSETTFFFLGLMSWASKNYQYVKVLITLFYIHHQCYALPVVYFSFIIQCDFFTRDLSLIYYSGQEIYDSVPAKFSYVTNIVTCTLLSCDWIRYVPVRVHFIFSPFFLYNRAYNASENKHPFSSYWTWCCGQKYLHSESPACSCSSIQLYIWCSGSLMIWMCLPQKYKK